MKTILTAIAALLTVGCGPIRPSEDAGKYFTLQHGSARLGDAMAGAKQHCARMGMSPRHLGTDRGGELLLSRFECVEK